MSNYNVPKKSYGVDVASYQSSTVNYAGSKFAFVKLSQSTNYTNPKASDQIKSALNHGMMAAGYFYAQHCGNSSVAKAEANYAVAKAKAFGLPKGSIIADDWEQGSGNDTNGSTSANTSAIMTAMQTIKDAGYKPMLYSGSYVLRSHVNTSEVIKKFGTCLWVASYATMGRIDVPNFGYFPSMNGVAIWQFTDNWKGYGVDGNISLIDLKVSASSSSSSKSSKKSASKPKGDLSLHPIVKWNIGAVAVVSNKNGSYIYTSPNLDKRESDKLKPYGSAWQVFGLEDGAVKVGKNQYFDGRAVYVKSNPIAYNDHKHGVAKVITKGAHALYEPKADSAKAYPFKINDKVEIVGRSGRFLELKNKYKGKTVYVTGNNAYIVL